MDELGFTFEITASGFVSDADGNVISAPEGDDK